MVQIYEIVYPISVIPTQLLVGVFKPNKKSTPIFKKKKKKRAYHLLLKRQDCPLKFQSPAIYNLKPLLQNQNQNQNLLLSNRTISVSQLQTSIATVLHCCRSCAVELKTSNAIRLCLIKNSLKSSILLIAS